MIIYGIEKHTIVEWIVTGQLEDDNIRNVIAKCSHEGIALTIKGMYEKEEQQYSIEALCRQLAEACRMAKTWLENGIIQEAIQHEDDFEKIVPQLEAALEDAKKAGIEP